MNSLHSSSCGRCRRYNSEGFHKKIFILFNPLCTDVMICKYFLKKNLIALKRAV